MCDFPIIIGSVLIYVIELNFLRKDIINYYIERQIDKLRFVEMIDGSF